MAMSSQDHGIIKRYFTAMQEGEPALEELIELFADEAVLIEPFSGKVLTHTGKRAIREGLAASFRARPPGLTLTLDGVTEEDGQVRADWTVTAPAFPRPMRGADYCTLREGKIVRLEVRLGRAVPGTE